MRKLFLLLPFLVCPYLMLAQYVPASRAKIQGATESLASVANSGTAQDAVFNFNISTAPVHGNNALSRTLAGPLTSPEFNGLLTGHIFQDLPPARGTATRSPDAQSIPFTPVGPGAIATTLAIRAAKTVLVTDYATCTGNNAVDDGVGINNAINAVSASGGGQVIFPNGVSCRVKNPVLMKSGVALVGPPISYVTTNSRSNQIQAAANMSSVITQADMSIALVGIGLINMGISGSSSSFAISDIVNLSTQFSTYTNNTIQGGTGNCFSLVEPTSAKGSNFAWVNVIHGGTYTGCSGYGIYTSMTDSTIAHADITGNASGQVFIFGPGDNRIIGNQMELSPVGTAALTISMAAATTATAFPYSIVGNTFSQNGTDQSYVFTGGGASFVVLAINSTANIYNGSSGSTPPTSLNFNIGSNIYGGYINENLTDSVPRTANIQWGGTNNAQWTVMGSATLSAAPRFVNLPTDAVVIMQAGTSTRVQLPGTIILSGGSNILYRCTVPGRLPAGALTTNSGSCGTATDTGLRVK